MENENKDLEPVSNEQVELSTGTKTKMTSVVSERKKSKTPLIIMILVILLALMGIYYVISSNPKVLLAKGIDNLSEELSKLPMSSEYTNGMTTDGSMSFKLESSVLDSMKITEPSIGMIVDLINKTKINYNFQIKENIGLMNIKPVINNKELLDIKLYDNGKKQYIFLEKLFDKYIEVDALEEAFNFNDKYKQKDYEYLFSYIADSFDKNLDSKYISKEKIKISINDKEESVTSTTLKMNAKQTKELLNKVLDDVKKDKKSNEIVTSFYSDFKDYKIEIEEDMDSTYSVYTKGITNKVVGMSYQVKTTITENDPKTGKEVTKPTTTKINYIKHKTPTIEILIDGTLISKIILDDNKITFNANIEGISVDVVIDYKETEVVKNKEYKIEFVTTISVKEDKKDLGKLVLTFNGTAKEGTSINVDLKNSIKLEDLSDEQIGTITTKLLEILSKI